VYVCYIQRWPKKEIRELVVIDGWDKLMNGDCNKKKKAGEENFIMLKEKKKAVDMHPGLKKNFKQGLIDLLFVVIIIAEANKKKVHANDTKRIF
jgi:hypothetical protein